MRRFVESLLASRRDGVDIRQINAMRVDLARLKDDELREAGRRTKDLLPMIAVTAVIASRVLGQDMFDVQLRGALALTRGCIAEMQTGEGKTLAAVPAIAWYARQGERVHVRFGWGRFIAGSDCPWATFSRV